MEVQYIHNNKHNEPGTKTTYYFELPDYYNIETELVKAITDIDYSPNISVVTGEAWCNPKDNYNKRIGREVAISKKQPLNFSINVIKMYAFTNEIRLVLQSNNLTLNMVLRKEYKNVRILSASEE